MTLLRKQSQSNMWELDFPSTKILVDNEDTLLQQSQECTDALQEFMEQHGEEKN